MLETRFRFSMSERRSGACACAVEEDDEGAAAAAPAPGPDASDAEDVSSELFGDDKNIIRNISLNYNYDKTPIIK